jgi:hypothetical protein
MNKLRKIGSHFNRSRERYLLALAVAVLILMYQEKEAWRYVAMDSVDEIHELGAILEEHGLSSISLFDTL